MHALRIGHQGVELLTTGRITLPVAEPERSDVDAVDRFVVRAYRTSWDNLKRV